MFINRPEATATAEEMESGKIVKGAAELIIAKHRNGSQGRVQLKFIGESTKFVDVDEQNRDDEPPEYSRAPRAFDDEPASEAFGASPKNGTGEISGDGDDELPFE